MFAKGVIIKASVIHILLLFCLCIFMPKQSLSQCGTFISTFPYTEGFETGPAWTSGGTNSDWAWGTPSHATISGAGGGTKCWVVGGLTGSFYNYGELSWIMSPCFDFSTVTYPWISFKIFWEDEWKYDGLVLQSSLNGGTTWTNVGIYGDPVDCLNDHWYDYNNVTNLPSTTPKHGWTGRIGPTAGSCQGGNGSAGWLTAKHCMASLAGQPSVRFRFLFGSGTTCNSFDGIAIDDILIDNAPPNAASFTYACASVNVLNFTNTSILCPTGYLWNFGDPGSGVSNTSTLPNPSHSFSAPGVYSVTLTASGPCNAPGSVSIPVTIYSVYTTVTPVTCPGANDGSATAHVLGGSGPFTYAWAPGGQTAQTITGLSAGTYIVTVPNSCPASTTAIVITNPNGIAASTTTVMPTCFGGADGTITASSNGGTSPITYLWSTGQTGLSINNIGAGNYCVVATDSAGCRDSVCTLLTNPTQVTVTANGQSICFGQTSSITANASSGTAPYSYNWNNGAFIGQTYNSTPIASTTYSVTATDAHGCISLPDTAAIFILQPLAVSTAGTSICLGGSANLTASGIGGNGNYSYSWTPGNITGSSISVSPTASTSYTVTLTDGCTVVSAQDSAAVIIAPSPVVNFSADKLSGCAPVCVNFTDSSIVQGGSISNWLWSFGDNSSSSSQNPQHCFPNAGNYNIDLRVTSSNGCINSFSKNNYISVFPIPQAAFDSDPVITDIYNSSINFTDHSTVLQGTISNWHWSFGDTTFSGVKNPTHIYESVGDYPVVLTVVSDKGCIDSVKHVVKITYGFTFYSPNAFTPNDNGINDVFLPKGTGWDPATFNLWVFDRWGNLCFYSTDMTKGWDGKVKNGTKYEETDVYVWKAQLSETSGEAHNYIGIVSIVH